MATTELRPKRSEPQEEEEALCRPRSQAAPATTETQDENPEVLPSRRLVKAVEKAVETTDAEEAPAPARRPGRPRKASSPDPEEVNETPPPLRRKQEEPEERMLPARDDVRFRANQLEGEWNARDMTVPYLSIGQKSGNMCDDHPEWLGSFVYDRARLLGKQIRVIVTHMKKRYEEKVDFNDEAIPAIWDYAEDAKASGMPFREYAEMDVLIEVPPQAKALIERALVTDAEGYGYIPARFMARKTGYKPSAGKVYEHMAGWLKGDIMSGFYIWTVRKVVRPANSYYVPELKEDGPVPSEIREKIMAWLGGA